MDRRKFLMNSGVALGGTALYMAGHDVESAAAQQLVQQVDHSEAMANPYSQPLKEEDTGYNSAEWGSDCVPYAHAPEIAESFRRYQPHGMAYMCTYMVANVMDNEGNKYNLLRQYKNFDTIITHATRSVADGVTMAQPLFKTGEMYMSRCDHEMIEKKTIQVKPYLVNPNLFTITREPHRAQWMDVSGRVNLEYKTLGPGLEYYCPGLVEDNLYRSEPYWVKGTIEGKEVQGFGVIDTAFGPTGTDWAQCKIFRYLEEYWVVWLNVYEDGTKDCGVYMDGVDNFGCGYFNQEGQLAVSRKSPAQIAWTPDGFLQGAAFAVGEHQFEFTMEARVQQVPRYLSWASGRVRRIGEERTPKMSFAWLEYLPKR